MKIFIDTANLDEIKEAFSWGIVDGITTNPSLIKKAMDTLRITSMYDYISQILSTAGDCPVSLEVTSLKADEMVQQATLLTKKFTSRGNIVIKIPICPSLQNSTGAFDGLQAIKALADKGIQTNATLVMTPMQALLSAKAGATYVSPFLGRIDDFLRKEKIGIKSFGKDDYYPAEGMEQKGTLIHDNGIKSGVDMTKQIIEIFRVYSIDTQIIAASVRNQRQVREVAVLGVDIATIPFQVLHEMITHHKTCEGVKKFDNDVIPEYAGLLTR
jgi:transaldolase